MKSLSVCLGSGSYRERVLNNGEGRQVFNVLIWNKSVWILPDLLLFVWLLSANTMSFSSVCDILPPLTHQWFPRLIHTPELFGTVPK